MHKRVTVWSNHGRPIITGVMSFICAFGHFGRSYGENLWNGIEGRIKNWFPCVNVRNG